MIRAEKHLRRLVYFTGAFQQCGFGTAALDISDIYALDLDAFHQGSRIAYSIKDKIVSECLFPACDQSAPEVGCGYETLLALARFESQVVTLRRSNVPSKDIDRRMCVTVGQTKVITQIDGGKTETIG